MTWFLKQIAWVLSLTGLFLSQAYGQVTIESAWAKAAAAGQMSTAAYMTVTARQAVKIIGAESPVASVVELHQMAMGPNDTMTMRAVPQIDLAEGQTLELKPGGLHIMLMDLSKTPLKPGDTVDLKLLVQTPDGKVSRQAVKAIVRPLSARDGHTGAGAGTPGHRHSH